MEAGTQIQSQDVVRERAMIEAESLVKTYGKGDKAVRALDGLSFRAAHGTIFALLGPNGAGKSTAVKILTTLTRPDEGRALVAGTEVVAQPDRGPPNHRGRLAGHRRRHPGDRSREPAPPGPALRDAGRRLEDRASELLERFGLADAADRIARGFSGGMRRRLDIAMSLVHDPQVLFLDEPTTGLDPEVRADMWDQIAVLASEHGKTVLLTTHYLEEADKLAARVAIVDRGKVVAEGTPDELKAELRGDAVYVDLAEPAVDGAVADALAPIAGVREVAVDGRALRARAEDGGRAVPSVLQALEARGIEVSSVRVARPSLDDVYLRYTGRTFQEAESEETEVKK